MFKYISLSLVGMSICLFQISHAALSDQQLQKMKEVKAEIAAAEAAKSQAFSDQEKRTLRERWTISSCAGNNYSVGPFTENVKQILDATSMLNVRVENGFEAGNKVTDRGVYGSRAEYADKEQIIGLDLVFRFGGSSRGSVLSEAEKRQPWVSIVNVQNKIKTGDVDDKNEANLALMESYLRFAMQIENADIPNENLTEQLEFNLLNSGKILGVQIDPKKVNVCRSEVALAARQQAYQYFEKMDKRFPKVKKPFDKDKWEAEVRASFGLRDVAARCIVK